MREDRHRLRLPVLEDLEVVLRQVADEVALRVGDDGVDLDVVDLDLEGDRRLRVPAAGGAGCASGRQQDAAVERLAIAWIIAEGRQVGWHGSFSVGSAS